MRGAPDSQPSLPALAPQTFEDCCNPSLWVVLACLYGAKNGWSTGAALAACPSYAARPAVAAGYGAVHADKVNVLGSCHPSRTSVDGNSAGRPATFRAHV